MALPKTDAGDKPEAVDPSTEPEPTVPLAEPEPPQLVEPTGVTGPEKERGHSLRQRTIDYSDAMRLSAARILAKIGSDKKTGMNMPTYAAVSIISCQLREHC